MSMLFMLFGLEILTPTSDATKLHFTLKKMKSYREAILAKSFAFLDNEDAKSDVRVGFMDEEVCKLAYRILLEAGAVDDEDVKNMSEAGLHPRVVYINGKAKFGGWHADICGCFHPDTRIAVYDRSLEEFTEETALSIYKQPRNYALITLNEGTNHQQFDFGAANIERMTHGIEGLPLVVLGLSNGRTLKLTQEHGVLTMSGVMVAARDLSLNDTLVGIEHEPVSIHSIGAEIYSGEVLNFQTKRDLSDLKGHVLFAEGVAVGDLAWQNGLSSKMDHVKILE